MKIDATGSLAVAVVEAIRSGDVDTLKQLLRATPKLATAFIVSRCDGNEEARTLLHIATDWPGHYARNAEIIAAVVDAGADVNARFAGPHSETPLHWAASSDDIEAIDALLDRGADIEADGAVIAGGTPLDDAVAFGQWQAARRLVERGAQTALWHAAAFGLMDRVEAYFAGPVAPARHPWGVRNGAAPDAITVAFWAACHGGQRTAAEYLLEHGAALNWAAPWDGLTPLDAAKRSGANALAEWLRDRAAKSAGEVSGGD